MNTIELDSFHFEDSSSLKPLEQIKKISGLPGNVLIEGPVSSGKTQHALYLHQLENAKNNIHFFDASLGYSPVDFLNNRKKHDTYVIENIDALSTVFQEKLVQTLNMMTQSQQRLIFTMNVPENATFNQRVRHDLFFKVSTFKIVLSGLKEKTKDFEKIVTFYLNVMRILYGKTNKYFSESALRKMKDWSWPGQIRELENVIERAFLVSHQDRIEAYDISFTTSPARPVGFQFEGLKLSEVERVLIMQTLEMTEQNRTKAAEILGISSRTLRNKLNEYREAGVL